MLRGMKQALFVITGASRGLGAAMAQQLLDAGHSVLNISRREGTFKLGTGATLEQWCADLNDPLPVARRLETWLQAQAAKAPASVTLINNAGVVSKLAPLEGVPLDELSQALRVGLEAPLLLSSVFLRATAKWGVARKLLFVSSGLGRRAMAASASYCAAKAGMDHLARALAMEQGTEPKAARVVSLAPGVIDTDMQVQLRGADPQLFPDREIFVGLKSGGQLVSPEVAARKVLTYLARADFGHNPVADVRDA